MDDLLETIFDNLQTIRTQQLFNSAVVQELIEHIGAEFDQMDVEIEAIKKQLLSDDPNTPENYDRLIKQERVNSLKRQLLTLTRKLMYYLEQKAEMDTPPYSLINEIDHTEDEIKTLRTQIEQVGRDEQR